MKSIIQEITRGIYGMAGWCEEWNTYMNCYAVKDEKGYILIDTLRKENSKELMNMLSSAKIKTEDIHTVLVTHGHKDHIRNIDMFTDANKFIHNSDLNIVEAYDKNNFTGLNDRLGEIEDLKWMLVKGHTEGSTAYYHRSSKVLFIGDLICFFGVPLIEEELVSEGQELRSLWLELVSSGNLAKSLLSQNLNPKDYAESFCMLANLDVEYLCSGHGVVLKHGIQGFIKELTNCFL